jgi:plastocyanin
MKGNLAMRNQPMFSALALVVASACVSQGQPGMAGYFDQRPECQPENAPRKVIINVTSQDFGVKPPRLCVSGGDVVEFRVVGNPHSVKVVVQSKAITPAGWLSGSTSFAGAFQVRVPDDASGSYFYDIWVPGFGTIDPVITVDR